MIEVWWLLLIAIAVGLIGGAVISWLITQSWGRRQAPEQQRAAPSTGVFDPRLLTEAVAALQALGAEAKAGREVLQEIRDAIQAQQGRGVMPLGAAEPVQAIFTTGRPLTLTIRGISTFSQLVQIERILTSHETIRSAGIESYQEGQARFLLLLRRPLLAETLQTALMTGLGTPTVVETAEPDRGELRLKLNANAGLASPSSPQPRL